MGDIPTSADVMDVVGRICANNFGMWLTRYGQQAVATSMLYRPAEKSRATAVVDTVSVITKAHPRTFMGHKVVGDLFADIYMNVEA